MKTILSIFILLFLCSCTKPPSATSKKMSFSSIKFHPILEKDDLSIRAIEIDKSGMLIFAGNQGRYGFYDEKIDLLKQYQIKDSIAQTMEFRAVSPSDLGINLLSAGSPALLYKVSYTDWQADLVYQDDDERIFYDALQFWNNKEGIAFGDALDGCMSVLISRDGGKSWNKISCENFPSAYLYEGAFAASNTTISTVGDRAWLASRSTVYHTSDKGKTWSAVETDIISDQSTKGIYSIDFYDQLHGIAIGGDYTNPKDNKNNLMETKDGGKTWQVISSASSPGYRSCIQYIPESDAKGLMAVGFQGIDLSQDGGKTWINLSDESFYTLRFLSPNSGYLAGKGRIVKFELQSEN